MLDWDKYDNEMAYSYDDFLEPYLEEECDCDSIIDEQKLEKFDYQVEMAKQLIEKTYE